MCNARFEVCSWLAFMFIVPVVSLFRFTVTGRILKAVTGFVVVTVTVCFCSPIPMKLVNSVSKSKLAKWHSTALAFVILPEH
ncbi:hypothetical protein SOASR015_08660 [Pectobacterium carotovorum subsp. carotovorum]|nr:hypothetical protein SOASR015_08660 [Pectobacterium carotovorum subsp. carotovorum]GLX56140.1 hypothetical protein Pcaca02_14490 [Pectobacterium carotovorum subsp. carotovorum]